MNSSTLRRILLGAICFSLAGNMAAADEGIKSKVEDFIGYSVETIFCEPIEKRRGSPIDPETCEYLSQKSLESCWNELTDVIPILRQPVDEYSSFFENPEDLDQLRDAVRGCIRSGILLRDEDASLYQELQYAPSDEPAERFAEEGWESAVESIVTLSTSKSEAVLEFVEAFNSSEYLGVYSPRDGLVIVTTKTQGDLATSTLENPPDWIIAMRESGFMSVDRSTSTIQVIGDSTVVTTDHRFSVALMFDDVSDLAKCDAEFEAIDCGVCVGAESDDFDTLVTWVSLELQNALLNSESSDDSQEEYALLGRCISDGIDEALNLYENRENSQRGLAD